MFKNCTLFIDGHDSKIKYYNPDVGRNTLYSHKFKRPGIRTQTVNDVNNMVIWVFNSERYSMGNDGSMFIKMNMHKKMHIADCLAADGGYALFIQKFKDISCEEGYDFSDKNNYLLVKYLKTSVGTNFEISPLLAKISLTIDEDMKLYSGFVIKKTV